MKFKVVGKSLILTDYSHKITEGENSFDTVEIAVPRYHDECDLSTLSFRFSEISENGETEAVQVLRHEKCDEKYIYLKGMITSDFSAITGKVTFMLTGINGENVVAKFHSDPFTVNDDISLASLPNETTAEQLFNQAQLEVQKAIDAADRAERFSKTPAPSEIYPAAKERLGGVLSGKDISVSATGTVTVNSVNGQTIPPNAKFTDTVYDDTEIKEALSNKINIENGKGLSSNNFTNELKSLYDSAALGGRVVEKSSPFTITNSVNYPIIEIRMYGKSIQNGIPAPKNHVPINSVGDRGKLKITVNSSSLLSAEILSGLPLLGMPVASDGNHTDSIGQQWVCDELIFNRVGTKKVVKRLKKFTLDGSEDWSVSESMLQGIYRYKLNIDNIKPLRSKLISSAYKFKDVSDKIFGIFAYLGSETSINGSLFIDTPFSTVYELKNNLQAAPVDVVYQLAIPEEITLSEAENSALQKLYTFNTETAISNSGNADMFVRYCTDKALSEFVLPLITELKDLIEKI